MIVHGYMKLTLLPGPHCIIKRYVYVSVPNDVNVSDFGGIGIGIGFGIG
jgi:hypothetical protein